MLPPEGKADMPGGVLEWIARVAEGKDPNGAVPSTHPRAGSAREGTRALGALFRLVARAPLRPGGGAAAAAAPPRWIDAFESKEYSTYSALTYTCKCLSLGVAQLVERRTVGVQRLSNSNSNHARFFEQGLLKSLVR